MDICVDAGGICLALGAVSFIVWIVNMHRFEYDFVPATVIPCLLWFLSVPVSMPLHDIVGKVKICHVATKKEVAVQQEAQRATIRKAYLELSKEGTSNESKEDSIRQAD